MRQYECKSGGFIELRTRRCIVYGEWFDVFGKYFTSGKGKHFNISEEWHAVSLHVKSHLVK